MSFRCEVCGEPQDAGTKPVNLLVESRDRQYENKYRRENKTVTVKSHGWEIVKELRVCNNCANPEKEDNEAT